jgi:WD40 repeat protein
MWYRTALLTSVPVLMLGLFGCGGDSGSGPTGPTEGKLEIIASTAGSALDPDGYALSVDNGTPQPLPANGADTVASLSPGSHTVSVAGVAPNCLLHGENPRNVDITAASTTSLNLDVTCSEPPASISVGATTTGEDLDLDGYQVAVDGGTSRPLSINGSVLIGGLTAGEHEVSLSGVADNCDIAEQNPRTVTAMAGSTADAAFSVTCSPIPLAAPGFDIAYAATDGHLNEVYLLSADGTVTNLTNNPSSDGGPAWSPDGETIAFTSNRTGTRQIYVMNADGSGQTQLTSGSFANAPAWSPDGSKIAFSIAPSFVTAHIYVMNPDGTGITQLTTSTAYADYPAWSPDGTKIAFTVLAGFASDVFIMNADGSDVIQLTTEAGRDVAGSWSPDGTKIYFVSDRNGGEVMLAYAMNPDGTGVTQLTFGTFSDIYPNWSPDGSKIAFSTGDRLYMMNPDGSEQVPLTPSVGLITSAPRWRP